MAYSSLSLYVFHRLLFPCSYLNGDTIPKYISTVLADIILTPSFLSFLWSAKHTSIRTHVQMCDYTAMHIQCKVHRNQSCLCRTITQFSKLAVVTCQRNNGLFHASCTVKPKHVGIVAVMRGPNCRSHASNWQQVYRVQTPVTEDTTCMPLIQYTGITPITWELKPYVHTCIA